MNYLYIRLELEADFRQTTPERKAFAEHLVKVAKALHDIEYVDSSDYGPGADSEAIRACLAPGMALDAAIDTAHEAAKELREGYSAEMVDQAIDAAMLKAPKGSAS